jgi:hypothetical protein
MFVVQVDVAGVWNLVANPVHPTLDEAQFRKRECQAVDSTRAFEVIG